MEKNNIISGDLQYIYCKPSRILECHKGFEHCSVQVGSLFELVTRR